jgi:uncharacterized membrane-anchored protein YitT (DUF2179 family)
VTTFCIIAGNGLLAFLVVAFIIPHDIVMGGTTGIGIVLQRLAPNVDVSYIVLGLKVFLLLLGRLVLGRKFALTTVASTLIFPALMWVFERIPGIDTMAEGEPLMASIFAGVLMGVSLGLVMRVGSSTGGMDVLNLIFHKILHVPVAIIVWVTDILVVGGQAIFMGPKKTMLGIIVSFLEIIILDKTMIFGKPQVELFVISQKYEEIRRRLLDDLGVGVTLSVIETGRLCEEQKAVICVISQRKMHDVIEVVHSCDPLAFITVTQIKEVRGRGFTVARANVAAGPYGSDEEITDEKDGIVIVDRKTKREEKKRAREEKRRKKEKSSGKTK